MEKNNFIKNLVSIMSSSFLILIIGFLLTPLISRLFNPISFGINSIIISFVSILITFISFRYEKAILIAKTLSEAKEIFFLTLFLILLNSFLSLIIIVFFKNNIGYILNLSSEYYNYLYFIPISLILIGFNESIHHLAVRNLKFSSIAVANILQAFIAYSFILVFGYFIPLIEILILGKILLQSIGSFYLVLKFPDFFSKPNNFTFINLVSLIRKYSSFPLFSGPSKFIHNLTIQLPLIFISYFYGLEMLGFFSLAYSVTKIPLELIGNSISTLFIGEMGNLGSEKIDLVRKKSVLISVSLAIIGLIPFFILFFFGPPLFSIVFGTQWTLSGEISRALAIMIYFNFFTSPSINGIMQFIKKLKEAFYLTLLRLISILSLFLIIFLINSTFLLFVQLYSLVMSLNYLIGFMYAQIQLKKLTFVNLHI
jgi:O-antigen/teichoic acid export membrane protein